MKTDQQNSPHAKLHLNQDVPYAVTINPIQQYNKEVTADNRIRAQSDYFVRRLSTYKSIEYKLWMECSDPFHLNQTKMTRLHLHGTLIIRDLPQWLLIDYNHMARWADVCFNTIKDPDEWDKYCQKQIYVWSQCQPTYDHLMHFTNDIVSKRIKKINGMDIDKKLRLAYLKTKLKNGEMDEFELDEALRLQHGQSSRGTPPPSGAEQDLDL